MFSKICSLSLRNVGALVLLVMIAAGAFGSPPDSAAAARERRVKVALALEFAAGCGKCRGDLEEARIESLHYGKPLVLFVGGCDGRAAELPDGVIPCRVSEYAGDGAKEPTKKRILIIGPKVGDNELWIWGVLDSEVSKIDLLGSINEAKKQAPKQISWGM